MSLVTRPAPIVLHPSDSVAILTQTARAGERPLGAGQPLDTQVASGHKIARADHATGAPIIKFGQIIGYATHTIRAGAHVHAHNCAIGAHDTD